MSAATQELASRMLALSDLEKLELVDCLLADLDQPDAAMAKVWAGEASRRWQAYQAGRTTAVSYAEFMAKYQQP